MREPHEIEKRISAYEYCNQLMLDNIEYNKEIIAELKDDLDKALDKEVGGW